MLKLMLFLTRQKTPDSLARINVLELGDIKHIFWGFRNVKEVKFKVSLEISNSKAQ